MKTLLFALILLLTPTPTKGHNWHPYPLILTHNSRSLYPPTHPINNSWHHKTHYPKAHYYGIHNQKHNHPNPRSLYRRNDPISK